MQASHLFKLWIVCNVTQIYAVPVASFRMSQSGTCTDHGLFPITSARVCEAAAYNLKLGVLAPRVTGSLKRPEGCYWHYVPNWMVGLWFANDPANRGQGSQEIRKQLCISLPNATMQDFAFHPKTCTHTAVTDSALECLRNSCEDYDFGVFGVNTVAWVVNLRNLLNRWKLRLNCVQLLKDASKTGSNCNSLFRKFASSYGYPNSIHAYLDKSTVNLKIAELCRLQCPCGSCSTTQTNYTCSAGNQVPSPASHAGPSVRKAMAIVLIVASTLIL